MSLIVDLMRAIGQMMSDRKFMAAVLWSVLLTLVALIAVFWSMMVLLGWVLPETLSLPLVGEVTFVDNLASWAAIGVMLVLSVFLMVPVAAVVVGFFLDGIVAAVERRYYSGLPPVRSLGVGVQAVDTLKFFGVIVAANLVALVIYFVVPPLAPFIFWMVNGFLLGREYFTLVAMRRLGAKGAARLRKRHAARIWLAGTAMAIPLSVPVLNLFIPVLGVAVFTHQFHRLVNKSELG